MGSMGLVLPTEDASAGVWDTLINAAFDDVEEHDHTSSKGVLVPTAGLSIDANLDWQDKAITNMEALRFSGSVATTGEAEALTKGLHVYSNNELYWVTSGGTRVKLTDGNALNIALVGGITGDYSSTDADCEYDDSTKSYEFKQDETPDHWANLKCADVVLYEEASGITSGVTLKSPGSLAAAYDVTFPTALPAATSLVTMTSAGVLSHTLTPSVTTVTTSGDVISGDDVIAASGDLLHEERSEYFGAAKGQCLDDDTSWRFVERLPTGGAPGPYWDRPGNGDTVSFNISLPTTLHRLIAVAMRIQDTAAGNTVSMQVGKINFVSSTYTQLGTTQNSDGSGGAQVLSVTGLTELAGEAYFIVTVTANSATAGTHKIFGGYFTHDRIA